MGAFNFLSARCGITEAQRMIMSGRIYSAHEMYERGLVDVVAPDGKGEDAVREHIASIDRKFVAARSVYQIRRRFCRLGDEDFHAIGEIWVEAALRLTDADLKKMRRLSAAQLRRRNQTLQSEPLAADATRESGPKGL
jgi:DSF synthase